MNIINEVVLNELIATLTAQKKVGPAGTVTNGKKNMLAAGIKQINLPGELGSLILADGTQVDFNLSTMILRYISLANPGLSSNFQYGIVCKGLRIPAWSASDYAEKSDIKELTVTIESQLRLDIMFGFNSQIDQLQTTMHAAVNSTDLLDSYLKQVPTLSIDGIYIDTSATQQLQSIEAMRETIEKIKSIFEGTKTMYQTKIVNPKTIKLILGNFDHNNMSIFIKKLETFNFKGKFSADAEGELRECKSQLLTVTVA